MAEKDAIFYLQPHKFGTRGAEVAKDRPAKELVIDAQNLRIADGKHSDKVAISNEFELAQALTRRSLACDLIGICTFASMERWHRYLFGLPANLCTTLTLDMLHLMPAVVYM